MLSQSATLFFVFAAVTIALTDGYRILAVLPVPGKSHFAIGDSLMKGLAAAGHEVYVINPFPKKTPIPNYHDVDISSIFQHPIGELPNALEMKNIGIVGLFTMVYDFGADASEFLLTHPNVLALMESGMKFDVVVYESFATDALIGLGVHFNASIVALSTFGASKWTSDLVGTPSPLSYVPHPFLPFTDAMSFGQRLINTIATFTETAIMNLYHFPKQEALYKKAFPNARISMQEARRNVSLVLLNQHYSISTPRPYVPNMIEVGGLHVSEVKPLPKKIQDFLDNSPNGVIYFSMGSVIQCVNLPEAKRNALIKVFSGLKENVLWKYENDTIPNKPDNVMIEQWMPQNDILAHPNVKLFITHGGLLGSTEALYHGKPVIGIPIYGDQYLNIARTELEGYGVKLDYNTLSEETLREALKKVIGNPMYRSNVQRSSALFRDRLVKPLDSAVYWVEYIARHRGASHMHSTAVDLDFFQYHLLDVYFFIVSILFGLVYFVRYLLKKLASCICGSKTPSAKKSDTQKSNKKMKKQ